MDNIHHILQNTLTIRGNIEVSPETLLYSSSLLSYEQKLVIFNAHMFISQSKHFLPT